MQSSPKASQTKVLKADPALLLDEYLLQQQMFSANNKQQRKITTNKVSGKSQQSYLHYHHNHHHLNGSSNHNNINSLTLNSQTELSSQLDQNPMSQQAILPPAIVRMQKILVAFFFTYIALLVSLYLTYAIYCYYQHTAKSPAIEAVESLAAAEARQSKALYEEPGLNGGGPRQDLEQKLHLLERYIEVIAMSLEETKGRLREREKCACSMGCLFNGTRFNDGQSWQQSCDTCTCQSGKISCLPRKCPKLPAGCDTSIQLPGQCCPVCMKSCKLNKTIVKHGQSVRTTVANGGLAKQCKCNDGMIRCESIMTPPKREAQAQRQVQSAQNKTREYLKSIMDSAPQLALARPGVVR